jgi:hypothetical protein
MLTQILDKWPDFLEVHRDEEGSPPSLLFVCVRKNSRAFQSDQLALLRAIEEAGLRVAVRVGTQDLTIDQFEKVGTYTGVNVTRVLAQSTFYNKQAELRRFEAALEKIPFDDPSREAIAQRVNHLQAMLGVAGDQLLDKEAVSESGTKLNRLLDLAAQQEYTDEQLMKIDWPTLAKIKGPTHDRLWKRKSDLVNKQKEIDNAERKPDVASEVRTDARTSTEIAGTITIPPKLESD